LIDRVAERLGREVAAGGEHRVACTTWRSRQRAVGHAAREAWCDRPRVRAAPRDLPR